MRSVEEKIDIPEGRKDDFRREIMNYIGALAIDGKKFDYKTNERLQKALELKLFEDQKDTIKLTSLVSNVVDKATQEKIDVVKSRLDPQLRVLRVVLDGRAELRGQHLCAGACEEVKASLSRSEVLMDHGGVSNWEAFLNLVNGMLLAFWPYLALAALGGICCLIGVFLERRMDRRNVRESTEEPNFRLARNDAR